MRKLFCINGKESKTYVLENDDDIISTAYKLSDKIMNEYENKTVLSIIEKDYAFFTKSDKKAIAVNAEKKLAECKHKNRVMIFFTLYKYIKQEVLINIHGFFVFRLRDYRSTIEKCVDEAVDDFLTKTEYDGTVKILSDYINLCNPTTELLMIMYDENKYIATDKNGEIIFSLKGYDDILIDVVIGILPKQIAIINPDSFENAELINTVTDIFKNKIIYLKT